MSRRLKPPPCSETASIAATDAISAPRRWSPAIEVALMSLYVARLSGCRPAKPDTGPAPARGLSGRDRTATCLTRERDGMARDRDGVTVSAG